MAVSQNRYSDLFLESKSIEELQNKIDAHLIELSDQVQSFTAAAALRAEKNEQAGIIKIFTALIVAMVIAVIFPVVLGRSVTTPIHSLNERLREIAEGDGDLTARLYEGARDETGDLARSFNQFISKLSRVIKEINVSADELNLSSENAVAVMHKTLENVETQRSETEMVASAVNEMSATTSDVAKNTVTAADAANSVRNRVEEGHKSAGEMRSIIALLSENIQDSANVIESLATETENIGEVTNAITAIADQTNLLALNAAIEAARAGDSGRGFAVVADEVRTLAQRTQTATSDIQTLVLRLQDEASRAVSSMTSGKEQSVLCLEKASETAKAFEDASRSVGEISDLNAQIAAAAEQQSLVAEEINKNLDNIKNLATETSEGANETRHANQSIGRSVISLHSNLNQFVV